MKISGEISIYEDGKLLRQSNNMLVDGAGKTIVDMLTTNPQLSAIASCSAILNASNYTIQAFSWGKDSKSWSYNAHSSSAFGFVSAMIIPNFVSSLTISSPNQINGLPTTPKPMDQYLEDPNNIPILGVGNYIPSGWHSGNLVNLLAHWFDVYTNGLSPFEYSSTSGVPIEEISGVAYRYGCFSSGITAPFVTGIIVMSGNTTPNTSSTLPITAVAGYNGLSNRCMDYKGFINYVGVSNTASVTNFDRSGLVMVHDLNFSSTLQVTYQHTIQFRDILACTLYGGANSIGLWSINVRDTLKAEQPPFTFHPVLNKRKYRLFSKKVYSKNLFHMQDNGSSPGWSGSTRPMTLVWKLKFN